MVKNYCTNKTLTIDENGINTDIAFLHKTLLKKAPPHQMKRNKKTTEALPFPLFSFN